MLINAETVKIVNSQMRGITGSLPNSVIDILNTKVCSYLTLSQTHEYIDSFTSNGLSINDSDLEPIHAVILVKCMGYSQDIDVSHIESYIDISVEKWEQLEDNHWSWFSNEITSSMLQHNDQTRYWVVNTQVIHGESNEFVVQSFVECTSNEARLIELQVAQQINRGEFNNTTYGIPCFDCDGLVTYPKSINEIECGIFKLCRPFTDCVHKFDGLLGNMDESVKLAWNGSDFK